MTITRKPVASPSVWTAADMADPAAWTVVLDDTQRAELIVEADRALAAGRTVATLERDDVTLASLQPVTDACVQALHRGPGFVLLRGFPVDRLGPEAIELAYLALGLQLGRPVGQDANATLLGHVRDERVPRTGPAIRLYQTTERQDFHTDGSDIVGLLCLQSARSGGESRIASAHAVYNALLDLRPDLVETLYEPMNWDRNDEQSEGEDPYFSLAPINDVDGAPSIFYIGWYIRDAQRHPDVPRLTAGQLEAMQLLEATANDPAFYVEMDFRPGDVQLLANAKILHSREAYEDEDDLARRRHLLRLWLTAYEFSSVDDLLRGGIPKRR